MIFLLSTFEWNGMMVGPDLSMAQSRPLQCRVARPFAKAVDRAFDLTRAAFDSGQAVSPSPMPRIVMAVRWQKSRSRAAFAFLHQAADQVGRFDMEARCRRDGWSGNVGSSWHRRDRNASTVRIGGSPHSVRVASIGTTTARLRKQVARMGDAVRGCVRPSVPIVPGFGESPVQFRGADKRVDARLWRVA